MTESESFAWEKAPEFGEAPPESDAGEEAPKRKERSDKGMPRGPRGESSPRRSRRGSLKEPIGGMLVMVNLPVQMFSPMDALDTAELDALATALDEQAKISPRFRKYVESMLGVASGGQLLAVVGMIGIRRAARHGFLGPNGETVDTTIGSQLAAMTGEKAATPEYAKPLEAPPDIANEVEAGGYPAVGGTSVS